MGSKQSGAADEDFKDWNLAQGMSENENSSTVENTSGVDSDVESDAFVTTESEAEGDSDSESDAEGESESEADSGSDVDSESDADADEVDLAQSGAEAGKWCDPCWHAKVRALKARCAA